MKEEISNSALDRLLEIAKDKTKATEGDIQFRCMTIEILGCLKVKNERVFDELKNIAEDKDELMTIRLFSIQQMGGAGKNEKIFDYLISKINEPNLNIREAAILRLGEPGNIKAGPYLMPLLNSEAVKIKGATIVALGTMGYKEATNEIIKNLKAKDENLITASIYALRMMKDDKAVEPLIEILLDKNQKDFIRSSVVEALEYANFKNDQVIDNLIKIVEENDSTSIDAGKALGEIGDARAVETLKKAIEDEKGPYSGDVYAIKIYKEAYKKITGEDYVEQE